MRDRAVYQFVPPDPCGDPTTQVLPLLLCGWPATPTALQISGAGTVGCAIGACVRVAAR